MSMGFYSLDENGDTVSRDSDVNDTIIDAIRAHHEHAQTEWVAHAANRDIEDLRQEQAYNAVLFNAKVGKYSLPRLARLAEDDMPFHQSVLRGLMGCMYINGAAIPGETGLFESCSREECAEYIEQGIVQVQKDAQERHIR